MILLKAQRTATKSEPWAVVIKHLQRERKETTRERKSIITKMTEGTQEVQLND